jgi:hypothetical protein
MMKGEKLANCFEQRREGRGEFLLAYWKASRYHLYQTHKEEKGKVAEKEKQSSSVRIT